MDLENAIRILTYVNNKGIDLKSVEINKNDMWLVANDLKNYKCMVNTLNNLGLETFVHNDVLFNVNVSLEMYPVGFCSL